MLDWSTASAIVATVVSVLGFFWGIATYGSNGSAEEEKPSEAEARLKALESWRIEVSSSIESLRQEIEHVREISDIKDEATNERLRRMEDKLDELLDLLISLVKERA